MAETTTSTDNTLLYRVLGGTMYTGLATGLSTLASIVSTKILTMYLPSSEFGNVVLIELVATFLRMVSGFSIGVAAIRSITEMEREEQKGIVDTVVVFLFLTFILIVPIFLVAQRWVYWLFGEEPVDNLAFLILAFALVMAYQTVLRQMLQGFFRFKQMALIDLGTSVLTVVLLVVFLVWFKAGLVGAVAARILAIGVACLFFYLYIPTKKGLSFRYRTLVEMLRFSWPLQLNEIVTFTYRSFGTLVVATVMTPADVALLAVAAKIPTNFQRLYEAFRTVYFPNLSSLMAQGDRRRAQKMLNATLRTVAFLMTSATVLAFVFQREIILLFYSEQYLGIGMIFVLMMLATTIDMVIFVMGNSTVAAGNSKAPVVINTLNTILTVLGNLTLVPLFGIIGAVLTRIGTRTLTSSVNVWFLRKTGLIPRIMDYVKPLSLFGALYAISLWLQPESWFTRLPFLLVFIVASLLLSIVTLQDVRVLWNSLMRLWGSRLTKWGDRLQKRKIG